MNKAKEVNTHTELLLQFGYVLEENPQLPVIPVVDISKINTRKKGVVQLKQDKTSVAGQLLGFQKVECVKGIRSMWCYGDDKKEVLKDFFHDGFVYTMNEETLNDRYEELHWGWAILLYVG